MGLPLLAMNLGPRGVDHGASHAGGSRNQEDACGRGWRARGGNVAELLSLRAGDCVDVGKNEGKALARIGVDGKVPDASEMVLCEEVRLSSTC